MSNVDRAQLAEARAIAPVAAVQNHFHVHRQQDPGLLTDCEAGEIGFAPFFPLGGGTEPLTRPVSSRSPSGMRRPCRRWRWPICSPGHR